MMTRRGLGARGSCRGSMPSRATRARGSFETRLAGALACLGVAVALVALASGGSAWGQCVSPEVKITYLNQGIEVFRVGDFDPSDIRVHPLVFTFTLCSDEEREAVLKLEITSERDGLLAEGWAEVHLAEGTRTVTNRDLTEAGDEFELQDYTVNPEGENLEQIIRDTGYLPEGTYCFRLTLSPAEGQEGAFTPSSDEDCLTVSNPLNLQLLGPGTPFGERLPIVLTAHPQFQWASRARHWRLEIAEVEPGDASGDDVMEHGPVYREDLLCEEIFSPTQCESGSRSGTVSWSYPSSAEDLARGRTYCWRVTAVVETSGGAEDVSSDVYCFRRWNPEDLQAESVADALAAIMAQLVSELGPAIEGMTPTGEVLVDGEAVDPAQVKEILDGIASGRLKVVEMEIR